MGRHGAVARIEFVRQRQSMIVLAGDSGRVLVTEQRGVDELTLVTCWPFDAATPGGPQRYVVSANRLGNGGRGKPGRRCGCD